jgi:hypothetical protein
MREVFPVSRAGMPNCMTDVLTSRETIQIVSPVHGDTIGWLPIAMPDEVADSVRKARQAAGRWARTAASERAERLHAAAAELHKRAHELAVVNEKVPWPGRRRSPSTPNSARSTAAGACSVSGQRPI